MAPGVPLCPQAPADDWAGSGKLPAHVSPSSVPAASRRGVWQTACHPGGSLRWCSTNYSPLAGRLRSVPANTRPSCMPDGTNHEYILDVDLFLDRMFDVWLLGYGLLRHSHTAFDRIDEVGAKTCRRKNMMQRTYSERPMHAMHAIKLHSHLAQLLGGYDFEEFVPLNAQPGFLLAVGLGHRLGQRLQALIFAGPGVDFAGKHDGRRRRATNNGSVSSLQRHHLELFVQRPRENYVRAPVVAGDNAKNDGAFEVHYGPPDLGAILKL